MNISFVSFKKLKKHELIYLSIFFFASLNKFKEEEFNFFASFKSLRNMDFFLQATKAQKRCI